MQRGQEIAIVGAGELGGALAHTLARSDAVPFIRLIDEKGSVATGKALDLMQARPIECFSTVIAGASDAFAAAGASVIVICDRAGAGEWEGDEGLSLVRQLAQLSPAPILCAGSAQRELIDRSVRELHLPHTRIFGSAPEAFAAAIRAIVALETRGSALDVGLTVLGAPPTHIVVPWDEATIGGLAATKVLDEPARRRISARLAALWPPGPYALAAAATQALEALSSRTRRLLSAFVAQPEDHRTRTVALPVRLGPAGVVRVEIPSLGAHDRVALDNAMLL